MGPKERELYLAQLEYAANLAKPLSEPNISELGNSPAEINARMLDYFNHPDFGSESAGGVISTSLSEGSDCASAGREQNEEFPPPLPRP